MVLFSKPKKMEGGLDVFIYKHSFKVTPLWKKLWKKRVWKMDAWMDGIK